MQEPAERWSGSLAPEPARVLRPPLPGPVLDRASAQRLIRRLDGITPGGPTAATFMSYGIGRRFSKAGAASARGTRGAGVLRSVRQRQDARPCTMLALGFPVPPRRRCCLGLDDLGLTPGPSLFAERPDFVWG